MKRIIAIILGLAVLLCAASVTAEGTQEKVTLGTVSINGAFTLQCGLPEGYKPTPVSVTPDQVVAVVRSEDPAAPVMMLSVAYDEKYYDVDRLNDLDQEGLEQLEQTFVEDDPDVEITYGETGYGTLLLIARHETEELDYVSFFSIYKGYCVEFALVPSEAAEDKNLTEDQLKVSVAFLTDLDVIPAGTAVNGKAAVAGLKFITNLTDYNPETNTVKATVMHGVPLPEAQAEALEVGGRLTAGRLLDEEITSLEKTEEGDILINGDTELRKYGDEYHIYNYDLEYLEPYVTLELEIPDTLEVLDGIDRESGEMLEEPVRYTVEEFRAMLAAEAYPDFATDNTWVTYDENGEMIMVEREYSPAQ